MPAIWPQIKLLLMHRTVDILLAYLNCHVYILFVVVFTTVGQLVSDSLCLFVGSLKLVAAGY